jgi:hypothetical protein
MVTFSEAFVLFAASALAAMVSMLGNRRRDLQSEEPTPNPARLWMLGTEQFFKIFLIHLGFASILLSVSSLVRRAPPSLWGLLACPGPTGFWDLANPSIPLLLNFGFVLTVGLCLTEGNVELPPARRKYVGWFCAVGVAFE